VPRPREYSDDLRQQLLDTAARLLATEGPQALSTRRVAADVGTSTTAIYSLIGSKEELVRQLFLEGFRRLDEHQRAVPLTDDPLAGGVKSDVRDGMRIDWDLPITMDDGVVVRADLYRPMESGRYPVIASYGPYAHGRPGIHTRAPSPWCRARSMRWTSKSGRPASCCRRGSGWR